MTVLIPYIYLMLIVISMMVILKKNFSLVFPLTVISISLLIMFVGYFGDLRIGVILPILLIPVAIFLLIKKKRNIKDLATFDNVLVFVLASLVIVYLCYYSRGAIYNAWDDYSHWGPMIKGMIKYNTLYSKLSINNAHPEYPPLVQSFEYLWNYLAGGYSESSTLRGLGVFSISLFFPVFEYIKTNNKITKFITYTLFIFVILLLTIVSYTELHSYTDCIYLDYTVSVVAAISIFLSFKMDYADKLNNVLLTLLLTSLLLVKEIGLAFFAMVLFVVLFNRTIKNRRNILKDIVLYVVIPVLILFSWKLQIKGMGGQFDLSKINLIDTLKVIFLNEGSRDALAIKQAFTNALINQPIVSSPTNLNFISLSVIMFIALLLVSIITYKKDYKKTILLMITYALGVFGYIFTMLILYLNCFSLGEALAMASFARYFGTYINIAILLIVLLGFTTTLNKDVNRFITCCLMILFVGIFVKDYRLLLKRNDYNDVICKDDKYNEIVNQLNSTGLNKKERVLIIQRMEDIRIKLNLSYEFIENTFQTFDLWDGEKEYVFKDKDELIKLYKDNYDYVYVYSGSDNLWNVWKKTDNSDLLDNRLYKVENDKLVLVPWISKID